MSDEEVLIHSIISDVAQEKFLELKFAVTGACVVVVVTLFVIGTFWVGLECCRHFCKSREEIAEAVNVVRTIEPITLIRIGDELEIAEAVNVVQTIEPITLIRIGDELNPPLHPP